MGIIDLFRPKHKHSDPSVRATAVRQLDADDADLLAEIVREDEDVSIRRIALKKIDDAATLRQLAAAGLEGDLRELAAERADSLLIAEALASDAQVALAAVQRLSDPRALAAVAKAATVEETSRLAVGRLQDPRALAEVAREAKVMAIRADAIARIDDAAVLRGIALSEDNREVAIAALDRIDDGDALAQIAKKAQHKAVRKRARARVRERRVDEKPASDSGDAQAERAAARVRQQDFCRTIEALSSTSDWQSATVTVEEAQRVMAGFEAHGDLEAEIAQRFERACERFFARKAHVAAQAEARARAAALAQTQIQQRVALCDQVAGLGQAEATPERIDQLRQAFAELPPLTDEARARELAHRFERACKDAGQRHRPVEGQQDLLDKLEQLVGRAEELVQLPKLEQARQRWEALEGQWHAMAERAKELAEAAGEAIDKLLHDRFRQAGERLDRRESDERARQVEREQKNQVKLVELCERLEALVESQDSGAVDRALKQAQSALRQPGPVGSRELAEQLRARLEAGRQRLRGRLQELREAEDWKRWSNVPRKEELCQQVEALLKLEDRKRAAEQLKRLQRSWKQVGPVPQEKSDQLWERFKSGCDKVREHCGEYFAKLEQERQENLARKQTLCEQVEALAESDDWQATTDKIKALQAQWKEVGPVPREQADAIWKRFRAPCDRFFERRKELHLKQLDQEREQNLERKEALCVEVEALADSTDWQQTAEQIKQLQARWKEIGPVPRKKADAIWKRFRGACDRFFEARDTQLDQQRQGHLEQMEALCAEVEALAGPEAQDELAAKVLDARARFGQIGPPPRAATDAIYARFRKACETAALLHPDKFQGSELDPIAAKKRLEAICARVRELAGPEEGEAGNDGAAVSELSAEDLASKLRQAMVDNTFKVEERGIDPRRAVDEVRELQSEWTRIWPVDPAALDALRPEFEAACKRVFALSKS